MAVPKPDKSTPLLEADPKSCAQSWFDFFGYIDAQIKSLVASALLFLQAATQSDQEAGTSNTVAVTPGRQQFHASAAKAWVKFAGSGVNGAQTINASYNVSGVSRSAAGTYTVTFTTAFSSANYAAVVTGFLSGTVITDQVFSQAAGSTGVFFGVSSTGAGVDPTGGILVVFGDQ